MDVMRCPGFNYFSLGRDHGLGGWNILYQCCFFGNLVHCVIGRYACVTEDPLKLYNEG